MGEREEDEGERTRSWGRRAKVGMTERLPLAGAAINSQEAPEPARLYGPRGASEIQRIGYLRGDANDIGKFLQAELQVAFGGLPWLPIDEEADAGREVGPGNTPAAAGELLQ